jgi:hypothetical protein
VTLVSEPQSQQREEPAPGPHSTAETRKLRWSDLLSGDDTVYAGNLRGIGCPEETIRDIMAAAIGHRFDHQREGIESQRRLGKIDALAYQAAIDKTWQEQNAEVNQLPQPAAARKAASASGNYSTDPVAANPAAGSAGVPATVGRLGAPIMPMAIAEPNPALGLTPAQEAAVDQVADQFAKTVNTPKLAPTDPAYHQLWDDAQADADERLMVQIGWEAYLQMEVTKRPQK